MNRQLPKSLSSFIWYFLKQYKLITAIFIFLALFAGFWGPFNALLIKHIINKNPFAAGLFPFILAIFMVNQHFRVSISWKSHFLGIFCNYSIFID